MRGDISKDKELLLISGLVRIDGSNQQYTASKEIWCYEVPLL